MIRAMLVLLLMLHILPVNAQLTIQEITQLTGSPQHMKGDFKQEKFIKAFDANIISTGHFEYQRNQFIHWDTVTPIENQMVMTPKSIASKQGDNELINMQSDKSPAINILSKIFFAVLTAEWETLDEYFNKSVEGRQSSWKVVMFPQNDLLKQSIQKVDLIGNQFLREVVLYEKNGDKTHIYFSKITQ
jgi:hypothetical protein